MSGSFEFVRWNACVHRLDLGLYSHPKEFGGKESEAMLAPREKFPLPEVQRRNGVRSHASSKGKFPSTRGSEEDQTHDAASCTTLSQTHY